MGYYDFPIMPGQDEVYNRAAEIRNYGEHKVQENSSSPNDGKNKENDCIPCEKMPETIPIKVGKYSYFIVYIFTWFIGICLTTYAVYATIYKLYYFIRTIFNV